MNGEPISQLAKALVAAQVDIGNPKCDRSNSHFQSRYATLASVTDAIRKPLAKHGLAVVQHCSCRDGLAVVQTHLIHSSGERLSSEVSHAADANIQRVGGVFTYLRRYALCAMLSIVGDEDDDAESVEAPKRKESKPKQKSAGAEILFIKGVDEHSTKDGKPYWKVAMFDGRENIVASTFSASVANKANELLNASARVGLERKAKDGREWLSIIEIGPDL